jgi:digeranylgeranylglycerophospholipid reductase
VNAQKEIDVLVVGLGPAGGAAAAAAAHAGLSVLAVERKHQVGVPVQCAEFIPLPLGKFAQANGVLTQRIAGMLTRLPSGAAETSDLPGLMIDRAAFDQALAQKAAAQGAELWLACRLLRLDAQAAIARIETPTGEREIKFRVLIAADGPHSAVAARLGLSPLETVYTRQYTVPLLHPQHNTEIWLSNAYPGGYAWLFPKGEYGNLGIGADKRFTQDLKQPLDRLHRDLIKQGLVGEHVIALTGGLIPVGGMRTNLVVDKILFAGDAAGLTHPVSGAGIAAALASGELAGEAAARYLVDGAANALEDYAVEVRERYAPSLERGVARRQWLNQYWHTQDAQADALHRTGWIAFPEYFNASYFNESAEKKYEYRIG